MYSICTLPHIHLNINRSNTSKKFVKHIFYLIKLQKKIVFFNIDFDMDSQY